jgi:hypothetical protein
VLGPANDTGTYRKVNLGGINERVPTAEELVKLST